MSISPLLPAEADRDWWLLAPRRISFFYESIIIEIREDASGASVQPLRLWITAKCCEEDESLRFFLFTEVRKSNGRWEIRSFNNVVQLDGAILQGFPERLTDCVGQHAPGCGPTLPFDTRVFEYDLRSYLDSRVAVADEVVGIPEDFILYHPDFTGCNPEDEVICDQPGWYAQLLFLGDPIGPKVFIAEQQTSCEQLCSEQSSFTMMSASAAPITLVESEAVIQFLIGASEIVLSTVSSITPILEELALESLAGVALSPTTAILALAIVAVGTAVALTFDLELTLCPIECPPCGDPPRDPNALNVPEDDPSVTVYFPYQANQSFGDRTFYNINCTFNSVSTGSQFPTSGNFGGFYFGQPSSMPTWSVSQRNDNLTYPQALDFCGTTANSLIMSFVNADILGSGNYWTGGYLGQTGQYLEYVSSTDEGQPINGAVYQYNQTSGFVDVRIVSNATGEEISFRLLSFGGGEPPPPPVDVDCLVTVRSSLQLSIIPATINVTRGSQVLYSQPITLPVVSIPLPPVSFAIDPGVPTPVISMAANLASAGINYTIQAGELAIANAIAPVVGTAVANVIDITTSVDEVERSCP